VEQGTIRFAAALRKKFNPALEPGKLGTHPAVNRVRKGKQMRPTTNKITGSAAMLAFSFFAIPAPAVYADNYCIKDGAQAAHGCGYPSIERCRAASSGIGGICSRSPVAQSSDRAATAHRST
jgi:hypothetical protein